MIVYLLSKQNLVHTAESLLVSFVNNLVSFTISIPHQSGTVTTVEPALTHHYHPKSRVYTKDHCWHCTTLVGDTDGEGVYASMGAERIWEISLPSA